MLRQVPWGDCLESDEDPIPRVVSRPYLLISARPGSDGVLGMEKGVVGKRYGVSG